VTDVLGILTYPLGEDFGLSDAPRRSLRRAYRRALFEKSNPRSAEYMRALFDQRYPGARIAATHDPEAETIVLLYPDSIGLGFGPLERRVRGAATVRVLNGRGRDFELDARARRSLAMRRVAERTMVVEAAALAVGVVATPLLLALDFVRGRR
jgi:hypothetical protein